MRSAYIATCVYVTGELGACDELCVGKQTAQQTGMSSPTHTLHRGCPQGLGPQSVCVNVYSGVGLHIVNVKTLRGCFTLFTAFHVGVYQTRFRSLS